MNGILGTSGFGPILGGGGGDSKQQNNKPSVKRIVLGMGSLSDLLGGKNNNGNNGLGDLLGGIGENVDSSSDDDDENEESDMGFSQMEGEDDEEDDDDDDEDEELEITMDEEEDDDEEDDGDGDGQNRAVSMIQQWTRTSGNRSSRGRKSKSSSSNGVQSPQMRDAVLRQGCIAALRNLCDRGSISQKQKRVLLTDIIACSARGEYSMVEVAYELLYGESTEVAGASGATDTAASSAIADEEFADQCRVFAESLLSGSSLSSSG